MNVGRQRDGRRRVADLGAAFAGLIGVQSYFDKVQVWLRRPVNPDWLRLLRADCGRGGVYARRGRARFDREYRQRLELRQPTERALQRLEATPGVLINRLEIAVDYVFAGPRERDWAYSFLDQHLVRRWHGRRQHVFVYPGAKQTRYDAGRGARNGIAFYQEPASRLTGQLDCLHLEWRANGVGAVRAAGVASATDLTQFSHHEFWEKHLLLIDVDDERFGRAYRNAADGTRGRNSVIRQYRSGLTVNVDARAGRARTASYRMQEIVDRHRGIRELSRATVRLDIDRLLPD